MGKWHLSDRMIYNDPVFDPPPYPGPVSIAWSHSGGSVAVGDLFGRLKILHLDGSESLLANQRLDKRLDLRWSPDDRRLLVEQGNQAWIVDIPTP